MRQPFALAIAGVVLGTVCGVPGEVAAQDQGSGIEWQEGPGTGQIGNVAQIQIPEGYRFAGREGVRRFLEMTQNPVSGRELAVMVPPSQGGNMWFVIFDFNSIGYVKDDEKNALDSKGILESIKSGTETLQRGASQTRLADHGDPGLAYAAPLRHHHQQPDVGDSRRQRR